MSDKKEVERRTIIGIVHRLDLGVAHPISCWKPPTISFDVAGVLVVVKSELREIKAAACFLGDTVEAQIHESSDSWWLTSVSVVKVEEDGGDL